MLLETLPISDESSQPTEEVARCTDVSQGPITCAIAMSQRVVGSTASLKVFLATSSAKSSTFESSTHVKLQTPTNRGGLQPPPPQRPSCTRPRLLNVEDAHCPPYVLIWARTFPLFGMRAGVGIAIPDSLDIEMLKLWLQRYQHLPLSIVLFDVNLGSRSWKTALPDVGATEKRTDSQGFFKPPSLIRAGGRGLS
ncbi:hypothetical protein BKA70DRAFT_1446506 [Coprinopsis sp. MPI-PUGE-AT-0042]|nr:hypothetical protein BKA70DRAFT_1446506 [Coprinopsis sp. MPI-PUGE-AT-0042]